MEGYCQKVVHEGGHAMVSTTGGSFKSIFVMLKIQMNAVVHGNGVLFVDATHLSHKMSYKHMLFMVTTVDGQGEVAIVAQGILPTENTDNWMWFLSKLKDGLPDGCINVVISDADKGITNAMSSVFPDVYHGRCVRHSQVNFAAKFGKSAAQRLVTLAKAHLRSDWSDALRKMALEEARGHQMVEWVNASNPERWARSFFPSPRYNAITSNYVEVMFAAIKDLRRLPPMDLLLGIERRILTSRFNRLARIPESVAGQDLLPNPSKIIGKSWELVRNTRVHTWVSPTRATVRDPESGTFKDVNLDEKKCSCGLFFDSGLPCVHALAVAAATNHSVHLLCAPHYLNLGYRLMYQVTEASATDPNSLSQNDGLLPPIAVPRQRGRPRTRRIESQRSLAEKNSQSTTTVAASASRNGQPRQQRKQRSCLNCGLPGHYQKNCHPQ